MHPVLFRESFFFCPRNDLERLHPLSQTLLDLIVAGANALPLRPIQRVDMGYDDDAKDKILIFVEEYKYGDEREPDYEATILDGDFKETFLRLQNTCVKEFIVEIRDSPFLRYWKAQEAAAFTVVTIDGVLDSIVNHLRPRTTGGQVEVSSWHENGDNSGKLELLARDSFLNSLQTCRFDVEYGFPPPGFFFNEPGYPNYDLYCTRYSHCKAADEIDGFIESFIHDGCANKKLESVSLRWTERGDLRARTPKQLGKPTKNDLPLPKLDKTPWLFYGVYRVSQCEMHSFVNKERWQHMEVYKWSVDYEYCDGRRTDQILQCRLKKL